MAHIVETAEMLAESIADMFGLVNQGIRFVGLSPEESRAQKDSGLRDHADDCQCRTCWCGMIARRMGRATPHEEHTIPGQTPLCAAALVWWEGHRPLGWTEAEHTAQPRVNCTGSEEALLAETCAAFVTRINAFRGVLSFRAEALAGGEAHAR